MAILNNTTKHVEHTLAMIKPNAYDRADQIEEAILGHGFTILRHWGAREKGGFGFKRLDTTLSAEKCGDFYIEHFGKPFYDDLTKFMSSGQIRVLILAKQRAISDWRRVMGPTHVETAKREAPKSLRAIYGASKGENAVHGSDSYTSAQREIKFFFPDFENDPPNEITNYLTAEVNPTLLPALSQLYKEEPSNPVLWLAEWLEKNQ